MPAETTIAVDPVHDIAPVRAFQAMQGRIQRLQAHAQRIIQREKLATVVGLDGAAQPVPDEGGRDHLQTIVLDVNSSAAQFADESAADLEQAQMTADVRRSVSPTALALPTQQPLDSFDSRTYPACYVKWWFGDAAPNLDRQ